MPERSSALSYQTTMPDYPDVSYETWARQYGFNDPRTGRGSRLNDTLTAWFNGSPSYETWRTNMLDQYNAQMSAYNTWLSTGAGKRASAESGDYNPSYFDGNSPSASPLGYESVNAGSGINEMAQGVNGLIQFIVALQGLKLTSEKIRGVQLENQGKSIENSYLDRLFQGKTSKLGYESDWLNMRNTTELYSRYKSLPELWKGGVFSPFGTMTYDLRNADQGLQYQKAFQDIELIKSGVALRRVQQDMQNWSAKEKKFYVEQMQGLEKDLLFGKITLQSGEVDLQKIRLKLEESAKKAGIAGDVVRSIVYLISAFR